MADTLRSICAQCPHLSSPQLNFLSEQQDRIREIVARDLHELIAAASVELEKAVVVLSGSVLEALLYALVQSHASHIADRRGSFQFDPGMGLRGFASVFNRWLCDALLCTPLSDQIVRYRDLFHVNRELNESPGTCGLAAREMLLTLESFLKELSQLSPHAA